MFYKYTHPFGSQYEVAEGLNEDTETPFYNFCVRNKDDLIYFNPYNYPTWMGRSSDAFSSTAGGTDTYGNPRDNNGDSLERGYGQVLKEVMEEFEKRSPWGNIAVTPIRLRHYKTLMSPEKGLEGVYPDAMGIRLRGDFLFRAIVYVSKMPNQFGDKTRRYFVCSPFIYKGRRNSEARTPMHLTERLSTRTNSLNKAINLVMSFPTVTFNAAVVPFGSVFTQDVDHVRTQDQMELAKTIDNYLRQPMQFNAEAKDEGFDNALAVALHIARSVQEPQESQELVSHGDQAVKLPEKFIEASKEFLRTLVEKQDNADETNAMHNVFVMQRGEGSNIQCFMCKPIPNLDDKWRQGNIFVSAKNEYETANELPEAIKGKLAALQINKDSLVRKRWTDEYAYLPSVGAFYSYPRLDRDKFIDVFGGSLAVVFLNHKEVTEIFL